ncbi:unnamed protein product, partial [marine sediment metagenome]
LPCPKCKELKKKIEDCEIASAICYRVHKKNKELKAEVEKLKNALRKGLTEGVTIEEARNLDIELNK